MSPIIPAEKSPFYEMASDEDHIYAIVITNFKYIYFVKHNIEQKTTYTELIDTLEEIYENSHVSNLTYNNGKLYFTILEPSEKQDTPSHLIRYYIRLYIYDGSSWNKYTIDNNNEENMRFIINDIAGFHFIDIVSSFPYPLFYFDSMNYIVKIELGSGKTEFGFRVNVLPYFYGARRFPNTEYPFDNYMAPSWIIEKMYEPEIPLYNGSFPKQNKHYYEGELIRFYDGNWENIYYNERNDYVLECIVEGDSSSEWNENILENAVPGDIVYWGTAGFRVYAIRKYIIYFSQYPFKTGSTAPSQFTYGTFISPDTGITDNNLKYYGGQIRPLRWLRKRKYYRGEYIVEDDKMFYCYQTPNKTYGKTGDTIPDFENCEHGDLIVDNEITWLCFDNQKYLIESKEKIFTYDYDDTYFWDKVYLTLHTDPSDFINFYKNTKFEFYNEEKSDELDFVRGALGIYEANIKSLSLDPDKEYKVAIKKKIYPLPYGGGIIPFPYMTPYSSTEYYPTKIHTLCDNNNIYIHICNKVKTFRYSPSDIPFDFIILDKNNLNIIKKQLYLPIDITSSSLYTIYEQNWRIPVIVGNKIYFAENDFDTWEEQVRCFKIENDSLSLEWVKKLPPKTTYDNNYYITTDGKYLYFFFRYFPEQKIILKRTDLNCEKGISYSVDYKKLKISEIAVGGIFGLHFILNKNIIKLPVIYMAEDDEYYSILIGSSKRNDFIPFIWFYWWTPECGDEYDSNVYSQTQKGEDPKRGEEWQS